VYKRQVEIICPNAMKQKIKQPMIGKIQLTGTGAFRLEPSCFMDAHDGRIVKSHSKPEFSQDLGISTIEEALHYLPRLPTYDIPNENELYKFRTIPNLNYIETQPINLRDVIKQVYAPKNIIPHLLRDLLITFAVLLTILGIMCIFPQVRAWAKACCFINNPTKYWRRYKHYNVPNFDKVTPMFTEPTSIIKATFTKGGIAQYRQQKKERKQRKHILKTKFEIDEIINKNRAAVEANCRVITAPILKNTGPIEIPTAPSTFNPEKPKLPDINQQKQVNWPK